MCGLTPRSSGATTAGHQARSGGTPYIFASPGLASCRCRPLSSNVRQHKRSPWCTNRVSACRRVLNSNERLFRPQAHDRIESTHSVTSMTRPRMQSFLSRFTRGKRPDQTARAQSVGWAAALQPLVASLGPQLVRRLEDPTHHLLLRGAGSTAECQQAEVPSPNPKLHG